MKKIYSIACALLVVAGLNAQSASKVITERAAEKNQEGVISRVNTDYLNELRQKGNLVDIWTSDFSNAADWSLSNSSAPAVDWTIGSTGPTGYFTNALGAIASTSGGDFAMFDSDFAGDPANGGDGYSSVQDSYITNATAIDLSTYPSVIVSFESYYRQFNDLVFFEVSTDLTNWTSTQVQANLGSNNTSENPTLEAFNISSTAGGSPSVYIRFRYTGSWDYAWMVDDVIVSEQLADDLKMNFSLVTHQPATGHEYGMVPASQLGDITVGGEFYNFGTDTQENCSVDVQMTDGSGATVIDAATAGASVASGDTLAVDYVESGITWTEGLYNTEFTLTSDNEQPGSGNFDDNTASRVFAVNNGAYALDGIDVYPNPVLSSLGTNSFTGGEDDFMMMTEYIVDQDVTAFGVEFLVTNTSVAGATIFAALLDTTDVLNDNVDSGFWLATSEEYVLTDEDIAAGTVTLLFEDEITLTPNAYYAGLQTFSDLNSNDIRILDDATIPQPGNASMIGISGDGVFSNGNALAIRLMTDETGSVNSVEEIEQVVLRTQSVPNPATDFTRISFELISSQNVSIVVTDVTGKVVMTEQLGPKFPGVYSHTLDVRNLSSGMHQYTIVTNKSSVTGKLSIIK